MNSILITGCNRGLGLGLVKELIKLPQPPKYLFATCRNVDQATELQNLAKEHKNIHILEIDLRNTEGYDKLTRCVTDLTKDEGLNVLFNNAGVAPKSTRITSVRKEDLLESLQTNTVVPIMLSKAFLPLLKKASKSNEDSDWGVKRAAIINMSSILGSINNNADGGLYAYRTSKAALNAATKSLSIDLFSNKVLCVSLHPGWVRTEMGGDKAPMNVETSTRHIVNTMLTFNSTHNGGFYQYDGTKLPW